MLSSSLKFNFSDESCGSFLRKKRPMGTLGELFPAPSGVVQGADCGGNENMPQGPTTTGTMNVLGPWLLGSEILHFH